MTQPGIVGIHAGLGYATYQCQQIKDADGRGGQKRMYVRQPAPKQVQIRLPGENPFVPRDQRPRQGRGSKIPMAKPAVGPGLKMLRSQSNQSLVGPAAQRSRKKQTSQHSNIGGRMNTEIGSPTPKGGLSRQSSQNRMEYTDLHRTRKISATR